MLPPGVFFVIGAYLTDYAEVGAGRIDAWGDYAFADKHRNHILRSAQPPDAQKKTKKVFTIHTMAVLGKSGCFSGYINIVRGFRHCVPPMVI